MDNSTVYSLCLFWFVCSFAHLSYLHQLDGNWKTTSEQFFPAFIVNFLLTVSFAFLILVISEFIKIF
jgi:uncharacterized membrane protein YadS